MLSVRDVIESGSDKEFKKALRRALLEHHMYDIVIRSIRREGDLVHILAYVVKEAGYREHASYTVKLVLRDKEIVKASCSCPGWALGKTCKHIAMVYIEALRLTQ